MDAERTHEYYKINETLLLCTGQWPFQSKLSSRAIIAFAVFLLVTLLGPLIMFIIKCGDETEMIIESIRVLNLVTSCSVKFISCIINSKKIMKLLISIGEDWKLWVLDREITILHEYANIGRKITLMYTVVVQSVTLFIIAQVTVPKIIDSLFFNGTMPGEFLYPAYYFGLDMQKHFFFCVGHMGMSFAGIAFIVTAFDTLFFINVQHACGIFAAIGHKLMRLGENEESTEHTDTDFRELRTCIARHNRGIEFAELIESTYSITFSLITIVNVIGLSLTGIQILITRDDLRAKMKCFLFFNVELIHLFMECYIPQILMDHSAGLRDCIYDGKWYNISSKSQKLLNLMIMRCNKPCKLTIGKICNMSLETFVSICQKTWSYFMVLRSFQY